MGWGGGGDKSTSEEFGLVQLFQQILANILSVFATDRNEI